MRILHLITELMPGGAERMVIELCRGQLAAGHAVAVCALKPLCADSPVVAELRTLGVPVSSLQLTAAAPWRAWGLRRRLRELAPDIVHAHLFHASLVARLNAGGRRRWKLVNTVHICERRTGKGWQFWLERLTLGRCDALTAVSRAVRDFMAVKLGVGGERIHLIPNGIQLPRTPDAAAVARWRAEWGVAECATVLGMVGRLDWQKGFDRVLELLPELARCVPPGETWALVILGEGKERAALERLADAGAADTKNLASRRHCVTASPTACAIHHSEFPFKVVLPGFRADAAACIGAFDLFLMPSRYEGFGLTLAEAMAHGVPVLASKADSLPELLEGYGNGAVAEFAAENRAGLVAEIVRLAAVRTRTPHAPYTVERMLAAYEALYRNTRREGG